MNLLVTIGVRLIRSQTLGASVSSLDLAVFNNAVFDTIGWSVMQAQYFVAWVEDHGALD